MVWGRVDWNFKNKNCSNPKKDVDREFGEYWN
jgi:hypothetical protein